MVGSLRLPKPPKLTVCFNTLWSSVFVAIEFHEVEPEREFFTLQSTAVLCWSVYYIIFYSYIIVKNSGKWLKSVNALKKK